MRSHHRRKPGGNNGTTTCRRPCSGSCSEVCAIVSWRRGRTRPCLEIRAMDISGTRRAVEVRAGGAAGHLMQFYRTVRGNTNSPTMPARQFSSRLSARSLRSSRQAVVHAPMHVRPLALDLEPIQVNFDRFNKYRYGPFGCFFEQTTFVLFQLLYTYVFT
jgi:hypothetical protein